MTTWLANQLQSQGLSIIYTEQNIPGMQLFVDKYCEDEQVAS